MATISGQAAPSSGEAGDVELLERVTRLLVGIALHSIDELRGDPHGGDTAGRAGEPPGQPRDDRAGTVTLPQFRLLLTLDELGRSPCAKVATAMGLGPSSVTRLADRLCASGHLARGGDPRNRSVVTLDLTDAGRALVARVVARRRTTLAGLLEPLGPAERTSVGDALCRLLASAGAADGEASEPLGPLEAQVLELAAGAVPAPHR